MFRNTRNPRPGSKTATLSGGRFAISRGLPTGYIQEDGYITAYAAFFICFW